jgi:hypothetical protein
MDWVYPFIKNCDKKDLKSFLIAKDKYELTRIARPVWTVYQLPPDFGDRPV